MVPKTAQQATAPTAAASTAASEPALAAEPAPAREAVVLPRSCRALVISRDPLERQAVVVRLGSADQVEPASAAGFHMAMPMIWQDSPDVLVIGRLTDEDTRRLPELRAHAPHARFLLLPTAEPAAAAVHPDMSLPTGADPLAALAAVLADTVRPDRGPDLG